MTETALYRLWMLPGAAFLIASGAVFLCINGQNLPRFEKIPRNRYFGLLTGWFALAWCIPHAQAVAPSFLLPFMWPLAVIVPIASFFCLDYMTSRAVGGIFIILAYEALHRSFNLDLPAYSNREKFISDKLPKWQKVFLRQSERCRKYTSIFSLFPPAVWHHADDAGSRRSRCRTLQAASLLSR